MSLSFLIDMRGSCREPRFTHTAELNPIADRRVGDRWSRTELSYAPSAARRGCGDRSCRVPRRAPHRGPGRDAGRVADPDPDDGDNSESDDGDHSEPASDSGAHPVSYTHLTLPT